MFAHIQFYLFLLEIEFYACHQEKETQKKSQVF